ncbi:uncharacterized protein LOC111062406 [Nilaparvata lugens]|uniref:uncharacterized protein LOC111062406 n=1 Tax=Nilaparvata lugens TaxID=108931 RepID=UPI00193DE325|nr:uncharacterized protein LOC111062406 [Nilaparvata lugens]
MIGKRYIALSKLYLLAESNDCGPLKNPKLDDVLAFSSFEHLDHLASTYQQRKNKTLTAAFKRWCSDESIVDVYSRVWVGPIIVPECLFRGPDCLVILFYPSDNFADDCGPLKNPKLDDVLAFSSFEHLDHLASTYQQRKNKTLTAAFKRWCSDESIVDVYTTIIDYAVDSAKFFAKEIHDAVIGLGTDDRTIIRIIVGRHEKNLDRIKNVYNVMYDTKLSSSIAMSS